MRKFIYSTSKVNAYVDVDGYYDDEPRPEPDLYVIKIWYETDPGHDTSGPVAAEEIITTYANSPQAALDDAKRQWSGPIDRIEIIDINPEGYYGDPDMPFEACTSITSSTAVNKDREDSKRNRMYRPSLYPNVDEERIEDLLAINWNDVYARDCAFILEDEVNFPDLSVIRSVSYPSDEEQSAIEEGMYDGGYKVTFKDGHTSFFAWHDGQDGVEEITIPETVEGAEAIYGDGEEISFREWLEKEYYEGFNPSDLSDEEYWDLEDQYRASVPRNQRERNYR